VRRRLLLELAAVSLLDLGYERATDLIGGFSAWNAERLPVRPAPEPLESDAPPGMGEPEPFAAGDEEADPQTRQMARSDLQA
jgi:hypothetical protein